MRFDRREILVGLAALSACGKGAARRGDVFAAGQPAAILIYALAPERLLGWPRRPAPEALAALPASADLPQTGALAAGGAPASLESVAALKPALIVDYGDADANYRAIAARVRRRIDVPYHLIDGALTRIPEALATAGRLLGVEARAAALADEARAVLAGWSARRGAAPAFYYARGRDGLETGFAGSLATEVLEGAGWTNVARGGEDVGRIAREQVAAWDPEVVVTLDERFAASAAGDPFWRQRRGGAARRILLMPEHPFGWIDRPPSINRLLGCAWLAGDGDPARAAALAARFQSTFYGTAPGKGAQAVPRWIG